MDNMIIHDELLKKYLSSPSSDDIKISSMFRNRATHLLDQAENMLIVAKNLKEKEWFKKFVHKLKMLASVIEQNIVNQARENESNSFTTDEFAQSLSELPASDGQFPQQNTSNFKTETVPETRPDQIKSNQMTSKLPLTLPDINEMKSSAEYVTIDHVTKPGMTPKITDNVRDELVEELESLHKLSSLEPFDRSITAPETSSTSVELATQPSLITERIGDKENVEQEKEKLKERIATEVAELKKLGETEENILSAMHIEGFKSDGNKILITNETKESENLSEHAPMKRVVDESNVHYWNQPANHIPEPPRQIYMNNTFLGMHINLPPVNPQMLRRQFHNGLHRNMAGNNYPLYHDGLKGTIQKLQSQDNQNFLQRNHMYGAADFRQQGRPDQQQGQRGLNLYGVPSQSDSRYPPDNPVLNHYVNPNFRPLYMPYPLNQNMEQRSNVFNDTKSTTYSMSKLPTEFSEEMKRQLRDGKVILLSDSVVPSNFTADAEKDGTQKTKEFKNDKN
ncbi:uncharacterized protein [Parasteatoda tepidariorum]